MNDSKNELEKMSEQNKRHKPSPNSRQQLAKTKKSIIYSSHENGMPCAIKAFNNINNFEDELSGFCLIRPHDNIVRLIKADRILMEITMELATGDLFQHIARDDKNRGLVTLERVRICIQILLAMSYMHTNGLIHRDIKPKNILKFETGFKLADLEYTVALKDGKYFEYETLGTPEYIAPESIHNVTSGKMAEYSPASDLWQFAVTLVNTISGCSVYSRAIHDVLDKSLKYFLRDVSSGVFRPDTSLIEEGPVKQLTVAIFNSDPSQRPTTALALQALKNEEQRLKPVL